MTDLIIARFSSAKYESCQWTDTRCCLVAHRKFSQSCKPQLEFRRFPNFFLEACPILSMILILSMISMILFWWNLRPLHWYNVIISFTYTSNNDTDRKSDCSVWLAMYSRCLRRLGHWNTMHRGSIFIGEIAILLWLTTPPFDCISMETRIQTSICHYQMESFTINIV